MSLIAYQGMRLRSSAFSSLSPTPAPTQNWLHSTMVLLLGAHFAQYLPGDGHAVLHVLVLVAHTASRTGPFAQAARVTRCLPGDGLEVLWVLVFVAHRFAGLNHDRDERQRDHGRGRLGADLGGVDVDVARVRDMRLRARGGSKGVRAPEA